MEEHHQDLHYLGSGPPPLSHHSHLPLHHHSISCPFPLLCAINCITPPVTAAHHDLCHHPIQVFPRRNPTVHHWLASSPFPAPAIGCRTLPAGPHCLEPLALNHPPTAHTTDCSYPVPPKGCHPLGLSYRMTHASYILSSIAPMFAWMNSIAAPSPHPTVNTAAHIVSLTHCLPIWSFCH